jgi:hypothetical protein
LALFKPLTARLPETVSHKPMKKLCPNCRLVNFPRSPECIRCRFRFREVSTFAAAKSAAAAGENQMPQSKFLRRAAICAAVCFLTLLGFYLSMIFSSSSLKYDEKKQVQNAINVLDEKGFDTEVFLLRRLTSFRGNDNWLNASTKLEDAYAATNFPFEIMTIYPDFFTYTIDDTERAAVLLHEAQHLKGADEEAAYKYVWRNRKKLGWTKETHGGSIVWRNVRKQTKEFAPDMFVCDWNEAADCTGEN